MRYAQHWWTKQTKIKSSEIPQTVLVCFCARRPSCSLGAFAVKATLVHQWSAAWCVLFFSLFTAAQCWNVTQPTRFPRIQFSRKEVITNLHLFRCIHHTCPRPISPKTSSANSQFISEYCKHQLKLLYTATLCCTINHCLFQSARLLPARDHQKPAGLLYHYNPHYSGAGNPNATVKCFP